MIPCHTAHNIPIQHSLELAEELSAHDDFYSNYYSRPHLLKLKKGGFESER